MYTKEETPRITDDNGINVLFEKPKEGQICQTKIDGSPGYHSNSTYRNGFFETVREHSNRIEITRWKADYWLPAQAGIVIPSLSVEDPYPNVQASGKIKVDTPEQSEAVQRVLFGMGLGWADPTGTKHYTYEEDYNWLTWKVNDVGTGLCWEKMEWGCTCPIHHLADFNLSGEPKPEKEFETTGQTISAESVVSIHPPTPKPFGTDDVGKPAFDQSRRKWTCTEFDSRPGIKWPACFEIKDNDGSTLGLLWAEANGDTSTGTIFTRTKPEQ